MARKLEMERQRHREELSRLKDENEEERKRMQDEIHMLREEQRRLKEAQLRPLQPNKDNRSKPTRHTDVYLRPDIDELLGLDPPPPYEPRATSRLSFFVDLVVNMIRFSWTPVFELQTLVGPIINRALRPRLQKDYSRIEWTCVSSQYLLPNFS